MSGDTIIQIGSVMDDTIRKHMVNPDRDYVRSLAPPTYGPLKNESNDVTRNIVANRIREALNLMHQKVKHKIEVPDHMLAAIIMGQEFSVETVIDGKPVTLQFHKKDSHSEDIAAPTEHYNDRQPSVVKELADKIAAVDDFIADILGGKPSQVSLRSPDQLFNVTNIAPLLKIVGGGWNKVLEDAERNRRQKSPNPA